ncbi:MAG: hypothetical protein U5L96_21915 [Owenweeksia sp.]|nr:hypothetical protein [Owenweeksia sp.]
MTRAVGTIGWPPEPAHTPAEKARVDSVEELIEKRKELDDKMDLLANYEERKAALEKELAQAESELSDCARQLSQSRKDVIPIIEEKIDWLLKELKMPDARFEIDLQAGQDFTTTGADKLFFAFSANAGERVLPLDKVASGGEMSRVMLALKDYYGREK